MKLWLVRHPIPKIDKGTCYGQLDVDVDQDHTSFVAKRLSLDLPKQVPVYSSSLIRAKSLANALHHLRPDLPFRVDARLNEVSFGKWEGVAWDQIPKKAIDDWVESFPDHPFGDGESVQDVIMRVRSMLVEFKDLSELILITHAGVIRAINFLKIYQISRIADVQMWPKEVIGFGELQCISLDNAHE